MRIPNWATHKFVRMGKTYYLKILSHCSVKMYTEGVEGGLVWTHFTGKPERYLGIMGAEEIVRKIEVFKYEV